MFVRFHIMWGVWFGGVIYDAIVGSVGWFPERSLSVRLAGDFDIAFFIVAVWVAALVLRYFEKISLTSGQGK